ncbi:MAG TPA: ATP-binding cassette domain-containing protein, partial [Acidimicrobiia bacterium]
MTIPQVASPVPGIPAPSQPLIVCDNLVKIYKIADLEVVALQGLDLLVGDGEFLALVGASGSGKSTLLNILGGL